MASSIVAVAGLVALAMVIVGLGLLLVHVLAPAALGRWDAVITEWFVAHRTSDLNDATRWGSGLGATLTIVGVAVAAVIGVAIVHRWEAARFVVLSLVVEFSVFLIATLIISRPRPTVPRLDVSPPTSSFPSGHTAAAIVLYVGLALVVRVLTSNRLLRAVAWFLAVALPLAVGLSRLYRGMHHTTDVVGSVVVATGALLCGLLAVRTGSAVAVRRSPPGAVRR